MKIIIIGAGEVGFNIAGRLASENKRVVVIDKSAAALERINDRLDVQTILASGSDPGTLKQAGIKDADILLAVTDSDEINLVACLMADYLSPGIKKVVRIRNTDFDAFHDHLNSGAPHIDTVINPETEVVNTIKRLMQIPDAVDAGSFVQGQVRYIGIRLGAACPAIGMTLIDFSLKFGANRPLIAAIVRKNHVIVPRGSDTIKDGDLVYFVCEADRLEATLDIFGIELHPLKNVLIVGGGRTGELLARRLEQEKLNVKIIEANRERCRHLSSSLKKTTILHGDGSDQNLFMEENIAKSDAVITVTNEDETNILVSLLAKNSGVQNTITRVEKSSYYQLLPTVGLEKIVSPRLSAISSILRDVRKGKVLSDLSIFGEKGEFIEAMAVESSGIAGKPIRKINFPKGALLVCIVTNGQIRIPTGDSVIEPGDRIIIFAVKEAMKKLEKLLTVRLGFF